MSSAASDHELLASFAKHRSDDAFAEVVRRYVDLVYSAARRQMGSAHDAQEVAQSVFVDLARHAAAIPRHQPLAPWLYVVTRRTAIDRIRREHSRREREKAAGEMIHAGQTESPWAELEPRLDEVMAELREPERAALILRFFENRSLREVGRALGVSDDTAQKRVSRALERLRSAFAARGLSTSTAGLATQLGAHAVEVAPAGLLGGITAALSATGAAALLSSATVGTWVGAVLTRAVAIGVLAAGVATAVVYEVKASNSRRREIEAWHERVSEAERRLDNVVEQRRMAAQSLSAAEKTYAGLQVPREEIDAEVAAWFARVTRLKQLAAEDTGRWIPELRLLTERDWFDVARDAKFATEEDRRGVLKELRKRAKQPVAQRLKRALTAYLDDSDGWLPIEIAALNPHLDPPLDADLLARYEIRQRGNVHRLARDEALIVEREFVDDEFDTQVVVSRAMGNAVDRQVIRGPALRAALAAYKSVNAARVPAKPAELLPFLPPSVPEVARQDLLTKSEKEFGEMLAEQASYVE